MSTKSQESDTLQSQYHQLQREQQQYKEQINTYDPQQLDTITIQIKELQQKKEALHTTIDQKHIATLINTLQSLHTDDKALIDVIDRVKNSLQESTRTLLSLQRLLNDLKDLAKDYTHQI
jgi:chromosome segregation ATPase